MFLINDSSLFPAKYTYTSNKFVQILQSISISTYIMGSTRSSPVLHGTTTINEPPLIKTY